MNDVPLPASVALRSLPEGWHILGFKVLTGSRLAAIGVDADLHRAWRSDREPNGADEAWRVAADATASVWIFAGHELIEVVRFPLHEPHPIVEQFPDGRWLVANSRSRGQGNARILGADGTEKRRFELGDGINHVKIDDHQRIWVGWFDEGIFGNADWRLPGLAQAPSAYGIAAFDERGALVRHATQETIADCYALNVFGDTAWACTYTDFPILQMSGGLERAWPTSLSGTRALAVDYPYVLAAGGYRDCANGAVLLRLDERNARPLGEWRLPFAVGGSSGPSMIDGRGDELHVVWNRQWHRWHVRDFVKLSE
jgi:hypothetical protein